jgi:hypothetical protein
MSTMYVNNIAPLEGNTINVASGNTLSAPGHVIQVQTTSLAGSSSNIGASVTSYTDTGLSVSITPKLDSSTIVVFVTASMALNINSTYNRARFDYRCLESGDNSIIFEYRYIGQENNVVTRQNVNGHGSYVNSSTSTKTFKCQARLSNGEDVEGGTMYPLWYDGAKFNITAMEIAG